MASVESGAPAAGDRGSSKRPSGSAIEYDEEALRHFEGDL